MMFGSWAACVGPLGCQTRRKILACGTWNRASVLTRRANGIRGKKETVQTARGVRIKQSNAAQPNGRMNARYRRTYFDFAYVS